ncbi:hypothetical protein PHYBOEH_010207 [Phytophthora boehmeriae]|uniref:Uncharacterized protein n=1 Tax=Phytophthora boehmeriae TaxID=109152 RepID=A0A8T1X4A9_9STRA|nr:hypothetical protein PHYBOEH_010207 [Phytophthora boehmeriae]
MEGDTTNDSAAAGVYSAGYDANSYADYYYEQQQPSQEGQNYNSYDLPAYEEDESYDCQQQGASRDDGAYAYPYNYEAGIYDLENYETAAEGQNYDYTYIYYPATEGYDASAQQELYAEIPESWSYSPSAEVYLDQVAAEQTASYYYDEEGNLVDGNGGEESPTNVFSQEAYWEADQINDSYGADASTPEVILESFEGTSDADDRGLTDSPLENNAREKHDKFVKKPKTTGKEARTAALSRKKSRKDRIEQRQALLEEEEEKRLMEQLDAADGAKLTAQTRRTKTSTFVGREKAKFQLKIRIAKAVRRNRMPVQIRILTAAAMCPLDWANVRGHTKLLKAIEKVR